MLFSLRVILYPLLILFIAVCLKQRQPVSPILLFTVIIAQRISVVNCRDSFFQLVTCENEAFGFFLGCLGEACKMFLSIFLGTLGGITAKISCRSKLFLIAEKIFLEFKETTRQSAVFSSSSSRASLKRASASS